MSVRFRIIEVWPLEGTGTFHAIGILEQGTIRPPMSAFVEGDQNIQLQIVGVALGGGKPIYGNPREVTVVFEDNKSINPKMLEGRIIVGGSDNS